MGLGGGAELGLGTGPQHMTMYLPTLFLGGGRGGGEGEWGGGGEGESGGGGGA